MKREDAISVLREIMVSCESFITAQAVSITMDKETKSYFLSVNWSPHTAESGCLDKILSEHSLEAIITNGRTVFRSR